MKMKNIYITVADKEKIEGMIERLEAIVPRDLPHLRELEAELNRATVVSPQEVPHDVITMNSRARIKDLGTGEESELQLVFPQYADPAQSKISVLSPIGTALIGYREGMVFECKVPDGVRKLLIEKIIFQPEANGNY